MNKIGLVILNFLTYEDTFKSIKTLSENLVGKIELNVYIVDNATNNIKYNKLKIDIDKLNVNFKIQYLASKENLGFARGMNIGIYKARKDGCNFVILSNNDIIYKIEIDFNKFIDIYNTDNSIAVIGPKILNQNGENQNPFMIENEEKSSLKKLIKQKIIFTNPIGKLIYFLFGYRNAFFKNSKKVTIDKFSQIVYALHGAFMILTPAYFKVYDNLDSNTFLYDEEFILAERVRQNHLKMFYSDTLTVYHKEDSSTNKMLRGNYLKKLNFVLNEKYKSRSYFLKKYIWK